MPTLAYTDVLAAPSEPPHRFQNRRLPITDNLYYINCFQNNFLRFYLDNSSLPLKASWKHHPY